MRNEYEINSDGINIYLTLFVKSHPIAKTLLSIIVLTLIVFLIYIASTLSIKDEPKSVFGIIIFGIFIFFIPFRYLLWNLFGKENLIINTKSLSYNRDFGIYKTNLKTEYHERLSLGFEHTRTFENIEYGNLIFNTYNEKSDLPELLYSTSINLDLKKINEIENEIEKLYDIGINENTEFNNVSLN
ncbi:hypothetical protein [Formosa sp. S-31]|uniref:hypothetical protein n=1 Tax=Formosa sp. S-31 TaxID=2790949 RepID=UPI003EBFD161